MSEQVATLRLYNTLTRSKEDFVPLDPGNVRMYVCGPTVYDFAHIGNARPVIVFDVLYRLLRHVYGDSHVTYVRNITDVDDKINARALRDFGSEIAAGRLSLNQAIRKVTEKTADQFHADVKRLGCLEPDFEPRATEHIEGMVAMAQALIDKGNAYVATGAEGREVLFDVASMPDYGKLSNRKLDEQQAGARVEVKDHKKNPGDFVLWKESAADQPGWDAHFHVDGAHVDIFGRPGWHIECSVMSQHHLGDVFDIHGGGLDLIFPHHENEIAQSRCSHGTDEMAQVWMHNGFVQVEGRKMSKSEGNFVTINELLDTEKVGGRPWPGEVVRLLMLGTHYRLPIDFTAYGLSMAEKLLRKWEDHTEGRRGDIKNKLPSEFLSGLCDDLNFSQAGAYLDYLCKQDTDKDKQTLADCIKFIGLEREEEDFSKRLLRWSDDWNYYWKHYYKAHIFDPVERAAFLQAWEARDVNVDIERRLVKIAEKDWVEADRIRDELAAQGVQLKDGKDPATGERVTTWEVRR